MFTYRQHPVRILYLCAMVVMNQGIGATDVDETVTYKGITHFATDRIEAHVSIGPHEEPSDVVIVKYCGDDETLRSAGFELYHEKGLLRLGNTAPEGRRVPAQNNDLPRFEVMLSPKIALDLYAAGGEWTVGPTEKQFRAQLTEGCDMTVADISANIELFAADVSTFSAQRVVGSSLLVEANRMSQIGIVKVQVDQMKMKVNETAAFRATWLQGAELKASTSVLGRIEVASVHFQNVSVKVGGASEVDFAGGRVAGALEAHAEGQGEFRFKGTVKDAMLTRQGLGEIHVTEVEAYLYKRCRPPGGITVECHKGGVRKKLSSLRP